MLTTNDPDNIYSTLKNFDIDKQIGKGQFSCVYRAKNKIDGTIVALKKVQVSDPQLVLNFFLRLPLYLALLIFRPEWHCNDSPGEHLSRWTD